MMTVKELLKRYVTFPGDTQFAFHDGRDLNKACVFWFDEMDNMSDELLNSVIYKFGIEVHTGSSAVSNGCITPRLTFHCSLFDYPTKLKKGKKVSRMEQDPDELFNKLRCPIPEKHTPITCDTSSSDTPCDTCSPSINSIVCM